MLTVWVYEADDFTSGVPAESAIGTPSGEAPYTLTLSATATPIRVDILDDDGNLDEIDANQVLASDVTINGVTYTAGTIVSGAFSLSNTDSGHMVSGIHIDDGAASLFYTGPVVGMMSSEVLTPGDTYTFDSGQTMWQNSVPSTEYVACFTKGTLIETADGPRAIETLKAGDIVNTKDSGAQPIVWIGSRTVPAKGNLAPIVFSSGAIGNSSEIAVSPQHRMLLGGWRSEVLFGQDEVLAPATHLVNGDTIWRRTGGEVTYWHVMFEQHEIITAHGCESESFHPAATKTGAVDEATRKELLGLFPELTDWVDTYGPTARYVLKSYESAAFSGV